MYFPIYTFGGPYKIQYGRFSQVKCIVQEIRLVFEPVTNSLVVPVKSEGSLLALIKFSEFIFAPGMGVVPAEVIILFVCQLVIFCFQWGCRCFASSAYCLLPPVPSLPVHVLPIVIPQKTFDPSGWYRLEICFSDKGSSQNTSAWYFGPWKSSCSGIREREKCYFVFSRGYFGFKAIKVRNAMLWREWQSWQHLQRMLCLSENAKSVQCRVYRLSLLLYCHLQQSSLLGQAGPGQTLESWCSEYRQPWAVTVPNAFFMRY